MKIKFLIFLIVLCAASISAQTQAGVTKPVNLASEELRRQSFEKVWTTVNEKHFDPTFGGVDWKKMKEIYEPLAMAAKTDPEFYGILQKMLGELNQSHFAIIPPNLEITTDSGANGEIGIELQFIENQAVVSNIEPKSTAETSGIKRGFVIEKIDGKSVTEILAPLEARLKIRKDSESMKKLYRSRVLMSQIGGKVDSLVKLEILDSNNKKQNFEVKRIAFNGEMSQPFGNFPAQQVIFESKILPQNIGYIRFNIWVMPQMLKLREAVKLMNGAKGIIFDLRGNPGGIGGMASGLAGLLVKERTSLGTMKSRTGETNFTVYPQENPFGGPVMILTDSGTGSTSEIFAAGLQEIGRAKTIGETSAGAVLPSIFEKLPTGALFQYAFSDYKSPNKILIEGRGVKPDMEVNLTRRSLLENRDLYMETAIKEILK